MTGSGDDPDEPRNTSEDVDDGAGTGDDDSTGSGRDPDSRPDPEGAPDSRPDPDDTPDPDDAGRSTSDDPDPVDSDDPDTVDSGGDPGEAPDGDPGTVSDDDSGTTASDVDPSGPDARRPPPSADRDDAPAPEPGGEEASYGDPVTWFLRTDHGGVAAVREVLSSVAMVLVVAAVLFAVSGIWPPLVAVESGSMEPHMHKGDLVFVVEDGRFAPDGAHSGVVTYRQGNPDLQGAGANDALEGYWSFGSHGNVIVFRPNGQDGTPIIHRAHIYVEEGENWYDEADPRYIGNAENCTELANCPAEYDGFITKGDNNPRYDQVGVNPRSSVVKPEWVEGVAKVRVPWLGCIRLQLSGNPCF